MKQVTVSWEPDRDRFSAVGKHRDHPIVINGPHDGPPTGFSASELLLAGVGGCSGWDVVDILRKQRQHVTGVEIDVSGDQASEPPWPYRRIGIRYRVRGRGLSRSSVERAVNLSVERYCSVIATIQGVASIETEIELVDESDESVAEEMTDADDGRPAHEADAPQHPDAPRTIPSDR